MRPYAVLGAGAVGSALAAYLGRRGHPVTAIGRPAWVHAARTQGGIRVVSRTETFLAPVALETVLPRSFPAGTVLFLTVQNPDLEAALAQAAALDPPLPVVTWQNGIRAEERAALRIPHVLGGVVRFTATMLEPGEVRVRAPGEVIVGAWPQGEDPLAGSIVEDLRSAGFKAAASSDIRADKALKLLVNLVSGPAVLFRRTGKEPALARLQAALLEEALRVFAAAGIDPRPASGFGETAQALVAHFQSGGSAPDTAGGIYNSTWQNLHHRRSRLENDAYHGEIVRLGERFGVSTPINARVLEVLGQVRREGLGPEPFDRDAFRRRFAGVVETLDDPEPAEGASRSDLEI